MGKEKQSVDQTVAAINEDEEAKEKASESEEYGGPKGLEPTRYGDWEKSGRCIDF